MKYNGKAACQIFRWLLSIVLAVSFVFHSCMPTIRAIPTHDELLKRYQIEEYDLRKVDFHFSYQVVLKLSTTDSWYERKGNSLDLHDDRQDDVYTIPVEGNGTYVQTDEVDGGFDFRHLRKITRKRVIIKFKVNGLPEMVDFKFVENKDQFFELEKDKNGRIITETYNFTCLDGCNSMLLFNAREYDTYKGIDHNASRVWTLIDWIPMLGFFALFAALYLFSS